MAYELEISERADRQIDDSIRYIAETLSKPSAAASVLDDIDRAYSRLESMAETFAYCEDPYLRAKEYRKLPLDKHDYVLIYQVKDKTVYIAGFFHMLENYRDKL